MGRCLEKRPEERYGSSRELMEVLESLSAPSGVRAPEPGEERSPYPALASFGEADAEHFFGREEEVRALWEKLVRLLAGDTQPTERSFHPRWLRRNRRRRPALH